MDKGNGGNKRLGTLRMSFDRLAGLLKLSLADIKIIGILRDQNPVTCRFIIEGGSLPEVMPGQKIPPVQISFDDTGAMTIEEIKDGIPNQ